MSKAWPIVFGAMITPLHAETISDRTQYCSAIARIASETARVRESGLPISTVLTIVDDTRVAPDQRVMFKAVVGLVYAMDGVDAETSATVGRQMCERKLGLR